MVSQFLPHGDFVNRVEGQLMISEINGPWNKEFVELWARTLHPLAKVVSAEGPTIGIAIVRGSVLCPPDAMAALREMVKYSASKFNCIAHVVVAERDVEGRDFLETIYTPIYKGVVQYHFSYELSDAKAWSLSLLDRHRGLASP